jgi:hypothetical protein
VFPFYNLNYQSAQPRTVAEQRQADVRAGELAAAFAELWHSLCAPVRVLRRFVPHRPTRNAQVAITAHRCSHHGLPRQKSTLAGPERCRLCEPTAC